MVLEICFAICIGATESDGEATCSDSCSVLRLHLQHCMLAAHLTQFYIISGTGSCFYHTHTLPHEEILTPTRQFLNSLVSYHDTFLSRLSIDPPSRATVLYRGKPFQHT